MVDRVDDDVELGVAQVGVDLGGGGRPSGGQAEGADGPLQVGGAVGAPQRQGLADGGLVDLDDADTAASRSATSARRARPSWSATWARGMSSRTKDQAMIVTGPVSMPLRGLSVSDWA